MFNSNRLPWIVILFYVLLLGSTYRGIVSCPWGWYKMNRIFLLLLLHLRFFSCCYCCWVEEQRNIEKGLTQHGPLRLGWLWYSVLASPETLCRTIRKYLIEYEKYFCEFRFSFQSYESKYLYHWIRIVLQRSVSLWYE